MAEPFGIDGSNVGCGDAEEFWRAGDDDGGCEDDGRRLRGGGAGKEENEEGGESQGSGHVSIVGMISVDGG
jgi:hypothetical protein